MTALHLSRPRGPALAVVLVLLAGMVWLGVDQVTDTEPSTTGDLSQQIDAYLEDELDDSRIPGASVAVVDGGETVHARGFGTDGHGNPVGADTPFWIGSNTKSVTALAIMQLVEDGLVDLDAPVQRYLPDFRVADPAASAEITVRHLLNQTSGISRLDGIRFVARGGQRTMGETVEQMATLQLDRPVGSSFEYANLNSVVLGLVVEQVTGQTWQQYVTTSIFHPLGMDDTFTDQQTARESGLTATYRSFFGFPLETEAEHLDGLAASGYVYSTATDMGRYLAMYLQGGILEGRRVLSTRGIEQMLQPATDARTFPLQSQAFTARYGAGWFIGRFGAAEDARWHQGSLPHFTAWMVLLPETDQAVVLMLNQGNQFELAGGNAAWSRIPQGVVDLMLGTEPDHGGSTPFFIVFTTLVLASAIAQAWHLARLVRAGIPSHVGTTRAALPLLWELGLAGAVLLVYPSALGGLGWEATYSFLPDLTLSVVVLAGLAIATGAVRAALLISRRSAGPGTGSAPTGTVGMGTRHGQLPRTAPPASSSNRELLFTR